MVWEVCCLPSQFKETMHVCVTIGQVLSLGKHMEQSQGTPSWVIYTVHATDVDITDTNANTLPCKWHPNTLTCMPASPCSIFTGKATVSLIPSLYASVTRVSLGYWLVLLMASHCIRHVTLPENEKQILQYRKSCTHVLEFSAAFSP